MMDKSELIKLVEPASDAPQAAATPAEPTEEQKQAAADQARFDEIMNTIEFTPANIVKARAEQTARRLPTFIVSTEQQVRRAAAMGVTILELNVNQADVGFKDSVIAHLEAKGFRVIDQKADGFKVDLREESYAN